MTTKFEIPVDDDGNAKPHNDPTLKCPSDLLRGVTKHHIVDGQEGRKVISSSMFYQPSSVEHDPYEGLSVELECKMPNDLDKQRHFDAVTDENGKPAFLGVLKVGIEDVRNKELLVGSAPLDTNPYHGGVWEVKDKSRLNRPTRKALLEASSWFFEAANVDITQPKKSEVDSLQSRRKK